MKILLTQGSVWVPAMGGANKSNRLLLEELARAGHHCRVVVPATGQQGPQSEGQFHAALKERGIAPRSAGNGKTIFEVEGVEVHAFPGPGEALRQLGDEIAAFNPDRVLVSSEDPAQFLLQAAVEASRHVVYLCHTTLALPFGPNVYLESEAKTELLRRTTGIVTVSRYLEDYIRRWGGLEAKVLPLLSYGEGPFPVLGRFDEGSVMMINPCAIKGISIFLELARRFPRTPFAAVPTWGTTAEDHAALEVLSNVRLLEPRDDIDDIFRETRVLVVPSLWAEALGRVSIEAMLRGIPVLAADVGGLPEAKLGIDHVLPVRPIERYLDRFDDRLLPVPVVPEQDADPWATALERVLGERSHYEALATAGRRAALEHVEGWGAGPLEAYLESLPAAPERAAPERVTSGATGEADGKKAASQEEASGGGALDQRLRGLSPARRALLLKKLKKQQGPAAKPPRPAGPPPIPRLPRDRPLPLSFAQRRLWFLDQLTPGSAVYNLPAALRLRGELDLAALGGALRRIVERHEVLRTNFPSRDGEPFAVPRTGAGDALMVADLCRLPPVRAETELERLIEVEARRPFDLSRDALLRSAVVRLAERDQALLLVSHHIVIDGWSMGLFFSELTELYAAGRSRRRAALPELEVAYADWAAWQLEQLADEKAAGEHLEYWRRKLDGAPVLELPTDRPRPAVASFDGGRRFFDLGAETSAALRRFARGDGHTLFVVFLAAFEALLERYSGQDDLVVGSVSAGRDHPAAERLIGFFIHTLALRTSLAGRPSFRELTARAARTTSEALLHQDLPFERIVDELVVERDASRNPLFQVMLAFYALGGDGPELEGLESESLGADPAAARFDLTLNLEEAGGRVKGWMDYSTGLFEATTIDRMLEHLKILIRSALAAPDAALDRLAVFGAAQRHQLIHEWNGGPPRAGEAATLGELIADQARRTPEAPAVVRAAVATGDTSRATVEELDYATLARRSHQLAHRLRELGVGPETRVGLMLEPSADMVVGVAGILLAGGAYVPLDPAYPAARLAFLIEDARIAALVTHGDLPPSTGELLEEFDGHLVRIDDARLERASSAPPVPLAGPDNAAYVIYTSGSTGKPKGVVATHRNVLHLTRAFREIMTLGPGDRLLMLLSLSFDASAGNLFPVLGSGAALVLHPRPSELAGLELARFCDRFEITLVDLPAALWSQWAEALALERAALPAGERLLGTVRRVFSGGESLAPERIRIWARTTDGRIRLTGPYGPTEATVCASLRHTVDARELPSWAARLPIGLPLPGVAIHLFDRHGRITAPIGVAGEVHIGGAGITRGYLRRPAATAERFVPATTGRGERFYKTGDLARRLASGELEFLGRADRQVKVRGFRIELEEIENALCRHPGVAEAAVIVREDSPGRKRLVAFVVGGGRDSAHSEPNESDAGEWRSFLARELPEFMVPALFVSLEALPLSPNGKVDRRALERGPLDAAESASRVAPRNAAEEALAEVWQTVLGLDEVGIHDNFFELGGDSILSLQIVARVRQAGYLLQARDLFRHQSIADLAPHLESAAVSGRERARGEAGLLPIQHWFFGLDLAAWRHFNQALLLRVDEALPSAGLEGALDRILEHHDALRLRFERRGSHWRAEHDEHATAVAPRIDLGRLEPAPRTAALERACARLQGNLDPFRGESLAAALFDFGSPAKRRLFLVAHHLVIDGVSWRVLLEDLITAWRDPAAPLPPRTTSAKQWAELLTELAKDGLPEDERRYWLEAVDAPPPSPWLAERAVPDVTATAATVDAALDAETTRQLLEDAPVAYRMRVDEVLLAALAVAAADRAKGADLEVLLEGHGREEDRFDDVDLSRTVGWLTASYPARLRLEAAAVDDPDLALRSIKEPLRAIPGNGLGWGVLRYLSSDPDVRKRLAARPEPRVVFNYLGRLDAAGRGAFLAPAQEKTGPSWHPSTPRPQALEIGASVLEDRLRLTFTFGATLEKSRIEELCRGVVEALRTLVRHCAAHEGGAHTPSDFTRADLSQGDLDDLSSVLAEIDGLDD